MLGRAGGAENVITPHSTSMKDNKKCIIMTHSSNFRRILFSNDKYIDGIDITPPQRLYHNQTCILGGAWTTSNNISRIWQGIIYSCRIYDVIINDQEIKEILKNEIG